MRIRIIHPTDCRHELMKYRKGLVPSHRVWGYIELEKRGHSVVLCPPCPKGFLWSGHFGWRIWQAMWLLKERHQTDAVLAIHEVSALVPLILKWCGVLSVPFVIVNMALLHPKQTRGFRGFLWRLVLRRVEQIVSLASPQLSNLEKVYALKRSVLSFTPMPVDAAFFQKAVPVREERFCLAVGTNDGKDFETLLSALPLGERLIVVTDSFNAQKVRRHRCFGAGIEVYEAMQMAQLRTLYQKAAVLIIPLIECTHGSGHTVFVEGQALGKILIVSGVTNMTDYVEDRVNAISVRVGDVASMRRAIEEALNQPGEFAPLRSAAKVLANERFSVRRYGEKLESVIQKATGDLAKRCSEGTEIGEFKRRETSDECVS